MLSRNDTPHYGALILLSNNETVVYGIDFSAQIEAKPYPTCKNQANTEVLNKLFHFDTPHLVLVYFLLP